MPYLTNKTLFDLLAAHSDYTDQNKDFGQIHLTGKEKREMEAKQTLTFIYQSLEGLPQNPRQAFILNRAKGLTYPEIAKQMGVSVSSVEKYILEALKHLRSALADTGK